MNFETIPILFFISAKNEVDHIAAIDYLCDRMDEVHGIDCDGKDDTLKVSPDLGAQTHFRAWPSGK